MEDGFREACRAAGKINRTVVLVGNGNARVDFRAVAQKVFVAFGKCRAVLAHIEPRFKLRHPRADFFDTTGELGTENQMRGIGCFQAVFDFFGGVAVV